MRDLETKESVLQEIIDLMDAREGDDLKKHPKLMAASLEVEKPEIEVEGPEVSSDDLAKKEDDEEEISPEQIRKLLEHFKDLK